MLKLREAFSGFSVNDLAAAKAFYHDTLGIEVEETPMGLILHLTDDKVIFVYGKDDHQPATYTILNIPVDTIDQAVAELKAKGVEFEHYEGLTDNQNIARGLAAHRGPDIAWFKDPAGNILAVLKDS